jgi:hypothetical protein
MNAELTERFHELDRTPLRCKPSCALTCGRIDHERRRAELVRVTDGETHRVNEQLDADHVQRRLRKSGHLAVERKLASCFDVDGLCHACDRT